MRDARAVRVRVTDASVRHQIASLAPSGLALAVTRVGATAGPGRRVAYRAFGMGRTVCIGQASDAGVARAAGPVRAAMTVGRAGHALAGARVASRCILETAAIRISAAWRSAGARAGDEALAAAG